MGLLRADPAERLTAERAASMLRKVVAARPSTQTPQPMSAPGQGHAPTRPRTLPRGADAILTRPGASPEASQGPRTSPATLAAADARPLGRAGPVGMRNERRPQPKSQHARQADKPLPKKSRGPRIVLPCLAGVVVVVIVIVVATRTGIASYSPTRTVAYPSGVSLASGAVALSPDGKTLAVGPADPSSAGGGVYFWDTANGHYLGSISTPGHGGVNAMAFSPGGTLLATATSSGAYVWDVRTRKEISSLDRYQNNYTAMAFSPEGNVVAYSGPDGVIDMWNVKQRHQIGSFGGSGIPAASLAFNPNGKELAVGYFDGSAQIWSPSSGRLLFTLNDQAGQQKSVCGDHITEIAFSPDGKTLAAGDCNGSTYLWNPATGRQTATLSDPGSTSSVSGIAFSGSGTTLASADYDQSTTYLWDVSTRRVIATLSDPVVAVAASSRGSTLATISNAGYAYLWSDSPAS